MEQRGTFAVVIALVLIVGVGGLVFAVSGFDLPFGTDESDLSSDTPSLQFVNATAEWNLNYHKSRNRSLPNLLQATQRFMGKAGVYVSDYNGDNRPDVLLIGGDSPILFKNTGNEFESSTALPPVPGNVRSALFFDYDRDGDDDLLLLRMADSPILLENTNSEFRRTDTGFDEEIKVPLAAGAADVDKDGCLDLFITQNGDWSQQNPKGDGEEFIPLAEDNGRENFLYYGNCANFDRADTGKIDTKTWSLATSLVDVTGNGYPDIHVANDFNRDLMYLNKGGGEFEQHDLGNASDRNAMSSVVADINRDLQPDIYVTNIWIPEHLRENLYFNLLNRRMFGNNLFLNQGDGQFTDHAEAAQVARGGWGWAAVIEDLNNDGNLDIIHATRDFEVDLRVQSLSEFKPSRFFNEYPFFRYPAVFEGHGGNFSSIPGDEAGFSVTDGRGLVAFDADTDGRLDILIANNSGRFQFYENSGSKGSSVSVEVEPTNSAPAIGAVVDIEQGGKRSRYWVTSNSDYLSQGPRVIHAGLPNDEPVSVMVTWPDGTEREFSNLDPNYRYTVSPAGKNRDRRLDRS